MKRPDKLSSGEQAFLLIEAALTVVVIAVGLVLITRGMAGSLAALARLQQRDMLMQLAESTMNEREVEAQQFGVAPRQDVRCDAPFEQYQWALSAEPVRQALNGIAPSEVRAVTLTVSRIGQPRQRRGKPGGVVQLRAIWPKDWIKE